MKLSWHGHSVIQLETINNYRIIIDPFITGNPTTDLSVDSIYIDYIVLTHAHNDHVGDALELSIKNQAPIITIVELADFLAEKGAKTIGMNLGGKHEFPFGSLKFVPALHSSSYTEDGINYALGVASGVIINDGATTIYHAGDTALFSDMKLFKNIDVALIPIGDYYTMGIEDAVSSVSLIKPDKVIPIHYNTFPVIEKNPYDFINRLDEGNGLVPEIGEIIEC